MQETISKYSVGNTFNLIDEIQNIELEVNKILDILQSDFLDDKTLDMVSMVVSGIAVCIVNTQYLSEVVEIFTKGIQVFVEIIKKDIVFRNEVKFISHALCFKVAEFVDEQIEFKTDEVDVLNKILELINFFFKF